MVGWTTVPVNERMKAAKANTTPATEGNTKPSRKHASEHTSKTAAGRYLRQTKKRPRCNH